MPPWRVWEVEGDKPANPEKSLSVHARHVDKGNTMEIEKKEVHRLWSALIGTGWAHDFDDDTWSDGNGFVRVSLADALVAQVGRGGQG